MTQSDLRDALEATWPAAAITPHGPFNLRDGQGGGKRVSATTLDGPFSAAALTEAEAQMGDHRLFLLRSDQTEFDATLEADGYEILDPTVIYTAPIDLLAEKPRPVSLLNTWPPLAIQRQIWADGGIGAERINVMHRAAGTKSAFIARFQNRAAGVGFVALHNSFAVMHALHVEPDFRQQGVARYMVRGMAHWAQSEGANTFALAVTQANSAARALYTSLGMTEAGGYHYREKRI